MTKTTEEQRLLAKLKLHERNHLVVLVAHMANLLGWKSGVGDHEGKPPADGYNTIVRIDLPTGQVNWHLHDNEEELAIELPKYDGPWDQSCREEKYKRIRAYFDSVGKPLPIHKPTWGWCGFGVDDLSGSGYGSKEDAIKAARSSEVFDYTDRVKIGMLRGKTPEYFFPLGGDILEMMRDQADADLDEEGDCWPNSTTAAEIAFEQRFHNMLAQWIRDFNIDPPDSLEWDESTTEEITK